MAEFVTYSDKHQIVFFSLEISCDFGIMQESEILRIPDSCKGGFNLRKVQGFMSNNDVDTTLVVVCKNYYERQN